MQMHVQTHVLLIEPDLAETGMNQAWKVLES